MTLQPESRVVRACLELAIAPVVALTLFRLCALLLAWGGIESVASPLVIMLYSAPIAIVVTYAVVLLIGVPTLIALHHSGAPRRWSVLVGRTALPFVVVFGFIRAIPTPALIVAGITAAVLAGQAAARVRSGPTGPPQGHDHAT